MEHEIATGPNMSIMQQFSENNLFKMVYFWMVAFSYGINLLLGQDLKFVKGFLAVSYSILKCILCSISCEDIRKGKLFTFREKFPEFCPFLFIILCTNVVSKWYSILDGNLSTVQHVRSQHSSALLSSLPTILLPPGSLTPTSGGLSRTAQLVHLHWALWS